MSHGKVALIIVVVGLVGIFGYRGAVPFINDAEQLESSDARGTKGTITIAVDGWVGYFPLCSPEMKKRLRPQGYALNCVDDSADYQARFKGLKKGQYDFVVATVDSYLLNGAQYDYPGPIVAVIDESKGGDAIVAWEDRLDNIDAFKAGGYRLAFTPDSPSHHLVKAVSTHFDIEALRERANLVEAAGSEDALKKLLAKDVQAAVLWEPDVSKALATQGIKKVLSTEETQKLIVDILVASRDVVQGTPEMADTLLKAYFKAQQHYRRNPDELAAAIAKHYDIGKQQATTLLSGVAWATLQDNAARWYGVGGGMSDQRLVDSIESAVDILMDNGDFSTNPIPNHDPYRLLSSRHIKSLSEKVAQGGFAAKQAADGPGIRFAALTEREWDALKPVGTLKVRPVVFASGSSDLTLEGKAQVDTIVKSLAHYPNFRVEVRGHSGIRGDKRMNKLLSQDRAESVLRYIDITYGVAPERIRSVGFGGEKPLARNPGESSRAYNYRLPRVEIVLVSEVI